MRTVTLRSGETVPALGLGTWRMGEQAARRDQEVRALRSGLDLGLSLIDTAEMYGEGEAEKVVAEAIAGRREQVFITSKVYPHNATRAGNAGRLRAQPEAPRHRPHRSLSAALARLPSAGRNGGGVRAAQGPGQDRQLGGQQFRCRGPGRCDAALPAAPAVPPIRCSIISANAASNGSSLPQCAEIEDRVMAYCPLGQGSLADHRALDPVARKHAVTPAAVALAWILRLAGHHCHSQVLRCRSRHRQCRRRRSRTRCGRSREPSTGRFRRRGARPRWP